MQPNVADLLVQEARSIEAFLQSEIDFGFMFASLSLAEKAMAAGNADEAKRRAEGIIAHVRRLIEMAESSSTPEIAGRLSDLEELVAAL